MKSLKIENNLLATHITNNPNFEIACTTGDAHTIMTIVDLEMKQNNLYTKGSEKLRADILRMTGGQQRISTYLGKNILAFVWNSRLSGTGFAVS